MITTFRSTFGAQLGWTWRDQFEFGALVDSHRLEHTCDLADGAATYQADVVWRQEGLALSTGQVMPLELDALSETHFGQSVSLSLAAVKALLIVHRGAGPGWLEIGGAAVDAWSGPFLNPADGLRLMPDSPLLLAHSRDGWPVDSQHAVLRLAAVSGPVVCDLAILGLRRQFQRFKLQRLIEQFLQRQFLQRQFVFQRQFQFQRVQHVLSDL